MARKDNRGRNLRTGETQRSDGRYCFRYTDPCTKKRQTIYNTDLAKLREQEKQILRDLEDGIAVGAEVKNMDVNQLFERYLSIRQLADSTKVNYQIMWDHHVREGLGTMKIVAVRPSHIKALYAGMSRADYARTTIKTIHNLLHPAFEMAVEDDLIRKNPANHALRDYGRDPKEREALSLEQQRAFFGFVEQSNIYQRYLPMLQIMIGLALRVGETIGLTWDDISIPDREVVIDHQLVYKKRGDGFKLYVSTPKTDAGIRTLHMTQIVKKAFLKQREYQMAQGPVEKAVIDGKTNFIFTGRNGLPMMPSAVNNVLYNIVDAYNDEEKARAKKERRKPVLLPKISCHILRHTGCTRMAETGMDPKVLQYIMGHANIAVTMEVYNHITGTERIEKEIRKLDELMVV